jgi:CDP-paratose 2-epimerase
MRKILITGAGGLVGSTAVHYFSERGFSVIGIENNMRKYFFGDGGDVAGTMRRLEATCKDFSSYELDIRNQKEIESFFKENYFELIIHTAAQPSHDWAAREPLTDFSVNAQGTLVLLEATRRFSPESTFVFMSTNKVYGDRPNAFPLREEATRFDLDSSDTCYEGIDETLTIDQSLHSLFGVSKVAADLLVQEYGRYFGMKTVCFRGGCLTGSSHAGVELHGFLSYLVKCIVHERPYTVYGYKGKQVRDNLHAFDVCSAIHSFMKNPKSAAVYNLGGTRASHVSILEAIAKIEALTGKKGKITYIDEVRLGDHKWYITDMSKFKNDYPEWRVTRNIDTILEEMCRYEMERAND